jgi:hypothetical protein
VKTVRAKSDCIDTINDPYIIIQVKCREHACSRPERNETLFSDDCCLAGIYAIWFALTEGSRDKSPQVQFKVREGALERWAALKQEFGVQFSTIEVND